MSIRHIAAAALLVCAGVAHADPISSGFLNNWTTGAGTDVLGSGVLGSNLNLVGGVSHASAANNAGLTDALLGQATNNMASSQTQLFYTQGIEGSYLLASGNGTLAASLGAGKSVIAAAGGGVVVDGNGGAPSVGGGLQAGIGGGSSGAPATGGVPSGPVSGGGGSEAPAATPVETPSNTPVDAPSGNNGSGNGGGNNANEPFIPEAGDAPIGVGSGNGGGNAQLPAAIDPAAVPEPSSIALMLAGMLGAGALTRRRSR